MKKTAKKLTMIPVLVMFAGTVMGCISGGKVVGPIEWTADKIGEGIEAGINAGVSAARDAKELKEFIRQRNTNPLDSPVESRLTRRTSTLAGGIPADVSPYLLHNHSFAVTEKGIQRGGSAIKISDTAGIDIWNIRELDAVITFKANKQSCQKNVTATVCGYKQKDAHIKQSMKEFAARQMGLKPGNIQSFQVQFLRTRTGKELSFVFDNVFVQETEEGYFQFDAEVEYQKQEVKKGKKEKNRPEEFAVFNKTYHSDLMTEAGAAFDVQGAIWNDARELSALKRKTPIPVINVVKAVKIPETLETRDKRIAKEKTAQFSKGGESPFTNAAEERLTRRTSTLAGGIPVDISPCLLHGNSFTVTEKGIQHYRSILESVTRKYGLILFEFDVALAFDANNQKRQMNATIAFCESTEKEAKKYAEKYMKQYAAGRLELDPKTIKNFKIKYLKTRKRKSTLDFCFDNVFVHTVEPGYFQFDAEIEYQKWKESFTGSDAKVTPDMFAVFNNVYRSDFTTAEAAAIDVQMTIWNDARKKGFNETPLPVINFVRAVKVKQ